MLEGIRYLFAARPLLQILVDVADVLIVTYVVYRALLVLRGTRAMQMGTGLGVIFLIYVVAKWAGLVTLFNLLSSLLSSVILIVVVVFQNDIRRGLMRVGSRAFFAGMARQQETRVIDEVVGASTELARHRIGALICFEQDANLDEFVVGQGTPVDAQVQRELLVSMFIPESLNKLHDGAVVIRNFRIAKAGVFFPMPDLKLLDKSLGSRHRAALGITEETDAVVVVVSEERGTISFCFNGNIVPNLDGASLKQALLGLFGQRARAKKKGAKGRSSLTPTPGALRLTVPPQAPTIAEREKGGSTNLDTPSTGRRSTIPLAEDSVPAQRLTDPMATRPMQPSPTLATPLPTSVPMQSIATPLPTPVPMQRSSPTPKDGSD
ncbi:MAG: diadenylate cyclase CdaA [Labilithrix sp.]|nr:diadenylate cyclase CdaA [Labilithrix sp.]